MAQWCSLLPSAWRAQWVVAGDSRLQSLEILLPPLTSVPKYRGFLQGLLVRKLDGHGQTCLLVSF